MLRAVSNGAHKPTHIMYKANLSWERMKRFLSFICTRELLKRVETKGGTLYNLTDNGKEVLNYFIKLEGSLYYRKRVLPHEILVHYK